LSAEMKTWGLCRDEFGDADHWPYQLYVREARRMVGEYVMSQKDIQTELAKPDAIGMGSYNSDSHNVQRRPSEDGKAVENEGDMQVKVTPYEIPYRVLLPKRSEATNLLVPVCFSATHVAYSTLRMEPQYMILGHAAGIAAKMALDQNQPVQDVDTRALAAKLTAQRGVLHTP
jgi:FAD dependent oxidoreductase